jgi:hypothetical protein
MEDHRMQAEDHLKEQAEQSAHAIYGLIIITAALVADREGAEDALTSLLVLWGAGLVLILAHVYSAIVGEVGAEGQWLSHAERHVLIVDNIPVLAAIVVPSLLMMVAGLGLISLDLAIDLSIVLSVAGLFALGTYQARRSGASVGVQLGVGALGGAVGIVVIALEVYL